MAVPTFASISPSSGLRAGGELLVLLGTGFASRLRVSFDGAASPEIVGVTADGTQAWTRSPGGAGGAVDVLVENLDAAGDPVAGESVVEADGFSFSIPELADGSRLEDLTRSLLREVQKTVPEGASGPDSVSVDYDDDPTDGARALFFSSLPGLALAGPRLEKNLFYRQAYRRYEEISGEPEQKRIRGPSLTYDALFSLTAASRSRVQVLNLINAAAASLHRRGKLSILNQPGEWLLTLSEIRVSPPRDGVHIASLEIRVVGFNIDEGFELGRSRTVDVTEVAVDAT